ncbi:hypothetical protein [Mesorhizobium sp. Cs1321R2N1]|uniref:hypothetical protein n=1 Tax=Mesorhizobium sp. Cs1321R2N1 TaxID=3015174 RepID=UPI00301C524F
MRDEQHRAFILRQRLDQHLLGGDVEVVGRVIFDPIRPCVLVARRSDTNASVSGMKLGAMANRVDLSYQNGMAKNLPMPPALPAGQPVELSEVISAVAERIHYAEGRRTNFTVVAGAMLAGGIAVLTFILDKHLGKLITYPIVVAAVGSLVLGIALLVVYSRQTNRYPWTAATKTWKWFYRDALPAEKEFNPKWWSLFWFGPEKKRLQTAYTNQLPGFQAKINQLSNEVVNFDQDVQQLYVLHINEKFKNLHLSQLRTIFQRGVFLLIALSTIAAFCGAAADKERIATRHLNEHVGGLKLDVSWHFISPSDDSQVVLVAATIENAESAAIDLPKWLFLDNKGQSVPGVVTGSTISVEKIQPGSRLSYSLFVKPAEPVFVERLAVHLR